MIPGGRWSRSPGSIRGDRGPTFSVDLLSSILPTFASVPRSSGAPQSALDGGGNVPRQGVVDRRPVVRGRRAAVDHPQTRHADGLAELADQGRRSARRASVHVTLPGTTVLAIGADQNVPAGTHGKSPRAGTALCIRLARTAAETPHRSLLSLRPPPVTTVRQGRAGTPRHRARRGSR